MGTSGQGEREDPVRAAQGWGQGFLLNLNCLHLSNSHRSAGLDKRELSSAVKRALGFHPDLLAGATDLSCPGKSCGLSISS